MIDGDDDSGLGNSDGVLHLGRTKPPLPPGIHGQQRIRSRSIGTASVTTPVRRTKQWPPKFINEHNQHPMIGGEAFSAPR